MRTELNEKKNYIAPVVRVVELDRHDIIASSPDDEPPYTGRLN